MAGNKRCLATRLRLEDVNVEGAKTVFGIGLRIFGGPIPKSTLVPDQPGTRPKAPALYEAYAANEAPIPMDVTVSSLEAYQPARTVPLASAQRRTFLSVCQFLHKF